MTSSTEIAYSLLNQHDAKHFGLAQTIAAISGKISVEDVFFILLSLNKDTDHREILQDPVNQVLTHLKLKYSETVTKNLDKLRSDVDSIEQRARLVKQRERVRLYASN